MDETLVIKASKLYGIAKEECNFIGGFQNLVYSYTKNTKTTFFVSHMILTVQIL